MVVVLMFLVYVTLGYGCCLNVLGYVTLEYGCCLNVPGLCNTRIWLLS